MPPLSGIVPYVPLLPAGNPAFVSPDERLAVKELIDIEFQRLGNTQIRRVEIDVVGEIVHIRNDGVVVIREALGREITDQVIVPQRIGIDGLPSHIHAGGIPTLRRRRDPLRHPPRNLGPAGYAEWADIVYRRGEAGFRPPTPLVGGP